MPVNEPISNRKCNRIHPISRKACLLISAIIGIWALSVQGMSQSESPEQRLRKRLSDYWTAMQEADFSRALDFVHPDSRTAFLRAQKARVLEWRIKTVACDDGFTSCKTTTITKRTLPGAGTINDFAFSNEWVLYNADWYLKVPWEKDENPFLDVFKEQREVAKIAPIPEAPATTPPHSDNTRISTQIFESNARIVPDPGNPTTVQFGEKAVFHFSYRNTGKLPIRILSAYSDCHCTSPQKEFSEVLPGQTGTFEVVLDTFGLPLGTLDKVVYVQFDDLDWRLGVPIQITSLANFIVTPSPVDFGVLEEGHPAEISLRLINQSGHTVRILLQSKSDPGLEIGLEQGSLAPNAERAITLHYNPLRKGEFMDNVMLQTDLAAESIISIPIHGVVGK